MTTASDQHMSDVMVDLETRGSRPGSIILSIGAVAFADSLSPRHFYTVVNTDSCRAAGLIEEVETMEWWKGQSDEARAVLDEAEASPVMLRDALAAFADFLNRYGGAGRVKVWGNGSDFDNAILAAAYTAADMPTPWRFWNNRCFRTAKNLTTVPAPLREGIHHNALDDAIFQATYAVQILAAMPKAA
ncbi:3'-5' exonuclease [Brevundimonas sp.]